MKNLQKMINVVNNTTHELPKYETELSAGMDVRANLWDIKEKFLFNAYVDRCDGVINHIQINPGGRALISTGLQVAIPEGYEIQVRPRSGLALKNGITVLNTPGTIDADYRGDIGVILINLGTEPFIVNDGDRIAQIVLNKFEKIEWNEVESLDETERGEGGFGHSGK